MSPRRLFVTFGLPIFVLATACDPPEPAPPPARPVIDGEDWEHAVRAYPDGIPHGARLRALREAYAESSGRDVAGSRAALGGTIPGSAGPIGGSTWFPVGPAPVQFTDRVGMPSFAGRADAVAVNPLNLDQVWLGTASGGVWFTGTGGDAWLPETDGAGSVRGETHLTPGALAVGEIRVDGCSAATCDRIWVGTGEDAFRRDTYYGAGILLGVPDEFGIRHYGLIGDAELSGGSVTGMVLDGTPTSLATRLWVSLASGSTSSPTHSTVRSPVGPGGSDYGIYRYDFTTVAPYAGTLTHEAVAGTDSPVGPGTDSLSFDHAPATDIERDPTDASRLLAGFWGRGVFVREASGLWCPLNPGVTGADPACPTVVAAADTLPDASATTFDWVEVGVGTAPSDTVYASFGNCPGFWTGCRSGVTLFKHTGSDLRAGWTRVPLTPPGFADSTVYSRYTHELLVDPRDANVIYIGGIHLFTYDTTNPGAVTSCIFDAASPCVGPATEPVHDDHHGMTIVSDGTQTVFYSTTDGGFYTATSASAGHIDGWIGHNVGLQTTIVHTIAGAPRSAGVDNDILLVGLQDSRMAAFRGGRAWEALSESDGAFAIVDVLDPSVWYTDGPQLWETKRFGGFGRGLAEPFDTGLPPPVGASTPFRTDTAFYPPMVQGPAPSATLFWGGTAVFERAPTAAAWSQASPDLDASPVLFPDTSRRNVITTMAVAPGDASVVYVGMYDGQVWVTDPGSSFCAGRCWRRIDEPGSGPRPPDRAVTSIGVSPRDASVAYVTFSGFGIAEHVWRSSGSGAAWEPRSGGLVDIPANVIATEDSLSLAADTLWLGTDIGMYRSIDEGLSWTRFDPRSGMPDVPVYDILVDQDRGRVYAATHGRGVFVLTQPYLELLEGWTINDAGDPMIWDLPIFGHGFPRNGDSCVVEVLRADGTTCASGAYDGLGGTMSTVGDNLNSTSVSYGDREVVWGCYNGNCASSDPTTPTPIANCDSPDPARRIAAVRVTCTSSVPGAPPVIAVARVPGVCPGLASPPSTIFTPQETSEAMTFSPLRTSSSRIEIIPTVQAADGVNATHVLCRVSVPLDSGTGPDEIVMGAAEAIEADPTCAAAFVQPIVQTSVEPLVEDLDQLPSLSLTSIAAVGSQLVTAVHVPPGSLTGQCFNISGIGVLYNQLITILKVQLDTVPSGAVGGGTIRFVEANALGHCGVSVPTSAGDTGPVLAARVLAALQARVSTEDCPSAQNLQDVTVRGDALDVVAAVGLQVCIDDPGVGFLIAPVDATIPLTRPPTCDDAVARPEVLWPANGMFYDLAIDGVSDPDGDLASVMVTAITQDELPGHARDPDAFIRADGTASIRAERDGSGDGRVYHVAFTATDATGETCNGSVLVCVPHDRSEPLTVAACTDGGPLFKVATP